MADSSRFCPQIKDTAAPPCLTSGKKREKKGASGLAPDAPSFLSFDLFSKPPKTPNGPLNPGSFCDAQNSILKGFYFSLIRVVQFLKKLDCAAILRALRVFCGGEPPQNQGCAQIPRAGLQAGPLPRPSAGRCGLLRHFTRRCPVQVPAGQFRQGRAGVPHRLHSFDFLLCDFLEKREGKFFFQSSCGCSNTSSARPSETPSSMPITC